MHTHLNALITSRLPLALPPHTDSPFVYTTGIIGFARIFLAFENTWDEICDSHNSPKQSLHGEDFWIDVPLSLSQSLKENSAQEDCETTTSEKTASIPSLLRALRPHGLSRSERIKRDLSTLLSIPQSEVEAYLSTEISSDATDAFIAHIERSLADKPHLLIAYAFTLYLAIFSGGRWIRSVLASPGLEFWTSSTSTSSPSVSTNTGVHEKLKAFSQQEQEEFENAGLALWFFSSLNDGADIKYEFKKRLEVAELLLSDSMKADIVAEAKEIFIRCGNLVGELDELVGRQGQLVQVAGRQQAAEEAEIKEPMSPRGWLAKTWTEGRALGTKYDVPGYAAWALVISSVSWYAMYHAESWTG